MRLIHEHRGKDDLPHNTVNRIRDILTDLGVLTTEQWVSSLDGIYSLNLTIVGAGVQTNGKGTTQAYALASAYAELMERLQNQILYHEVDISTEGIEYGGFYFAPDEKIMSVKETLETEGELLKYYVPEWFPDTAPGTGRYELARKWTAENPTSCPDDFICLPYFNLNQGKISYLPYQMTRYPYGSNGMSAGNTPEEALVQGISEILERYVNKEIITKKISPPTIPGEYLKKYPALYQLIQKFQHNGKYRLIVKDCSLGQGYPALCVIAVNRETQSYFVKFGAHPVFEIALERCLTELLQGKDWQNRLSGMMTSFAYADNAVNHPANLTNVMRTGQGTYPAALFSERFSYYFTEFKDVNASSNKELLAYLIKFLIDKSHTVLVRDASYLGFPSFHIIVPGLSEIFEYDDGLLGAQNLRDKARKIIRDLGQATHQELRQVISFLIRRAPYIMEAENITRLLFPVEKSFPWHTIDNHYFIAAALYKMGKTKEACGMLKQLVDRYTLMANIQPDFQQEQLTFYKCVKDYLHTRLAGSGEQEILDLLTIFYSDSVVTEVIEQWGNPETVFNNYGVLNCWNCQECVFKNYCSQNNITELHKKLKDKKVQNQIDQNHLRYLYH